MPEHLHTFPIQRDFDRAAVHTCRECGDTFPDPQAVPHRWSDAPLAPSHVCALGIPGVRETDHAHFSPKPMGCCSPAPLPPLEESFPGPSVFRCVYVPQTMDKAEASLSLLGNSWTAQNFAHLFRGL